MIIYEDYLCSVDIDNLGHISFTTSVTGEERRYSIVRHPATPTIYLVKEGECGFDIFGRFRIPDKYEPDDEKNIEDWKFLAMDCNAEIARFFTIDPVKLCELMNKTYGLDIRVKVDREMLDIPRQGEEDSAGTTVAHFYVIIHGGRRSGDRRYVGNDYMHDPVKLKRILINEVMRAARDAVLLRGASKLNEGEKQ